MLKTITIYNILLEAKYSNDNMKKCMLYNKQKCVTQNKKIILFYGV